MFISFPAPIRYPPWWVHILQVSSSAVLVALWPLATPAAWDPCRVWYLLPGSSQAVGDHPTPLGLWRRKRQSPACADDVCCGRALWGRVPSCCVPQACPCPLETQLHPNTAIAFQLLFPLHFWQSCANLNRRFPSLLQKAVEEECPPPGSVSSSHWKRHCKYIPLHCLVLYLV